MEQERAARRRKLTVARRELLQLSEANLPGLIDMEPAFEHVETPDAAGFRGQVLYSPHGFIYDSPQVPSEAGPRPCAHPTPADSTLSTYV